MSDNPAATSRGGREAALSKSVLDSRCPTSGIWLASFHDTQVLAGAASMGVYFAPFNLCQVQITTSGNLIDFIGH
jgi:hypothetical protein